MRRLGRTVIAFALAAGIAAGAALPVSAATQSNGTPMVATTLQAVQFGYDPGKIILPYGAMLAPDGKGNWVLAFLDTSFAVLNGKSGAVTLANGFTVAMNKEGIVYSKNIEGMPIKVTYNLSNCVSRVEAGNKIVLYKNGSLLNRIITNYGPVYTIETYNDSGAILSNEMRYTGSNVLISLDDYVRTPGMIIRTVYDAYGTPVSTLPYYGDTKPAYY
ncbi:MAG: hypothetical protein J5518_00525 [Lachnospiraceae bacterium]|nr:hypothetical protein [Lachnospiraceae bacterium]